MHTKFTLSNIALLFITASVCVLLVLSKIYYWQTIDIFALPFNDGEDLESLLQQSDIELIASAGYFEFIMYLDTVKSHLLDTIISLFGFEINALFIALFGMISVLCLIYLFIRRNNRVAYVPLLCCCLSGILFVSIQPEISIKQVGQALSTENDYKDPEINYLDLLREEKYTELDSHLKTAETAFENNDVLEYQYIDTYEAFQSADETDLIYFNRWLENVTDSTNALIARGIVYENLGWVARGGNFASETSEHEFALMREYFSKAVKDHNKVLEEGNKSLLSYASLTNMAAAYDFGTKKEVLFERGLDAFPESHYLPSHYMHKLQPKWGGSYKQIRNLAIRMRERAKNNPMLITLGGAELRYRANQLNKENEDEEALVYDRFSIFYGADVQGAINLAVAYDKKNDSDSALTALSHTLQFHPGNARLLANRAYYNALAGNEASAIHDIENVDIDKINESWDSDRIADAHAELQQKHKAIPYYIKSINLNPKAEYAYNRLYWLSYKKVMSYEDALPHMKQWTEEDPYSSDAWIAYAGILKEIDEKSSIPAYRKYLEYANRGNSIDMNAIKYVEKVIKKVESQ